MRPRLAIAAQPSAPMPVDHLRRLESSALYRRREIDTARSRQLSIVKALLYLHEDYREQYHARLEGR